MLSLSVDDGSAYDLRIFALSQKHKIPATFYWPVEWVSLAFDKGYAPMSLSDALLIAKTSEIGSHTVTHRLLTQIPQNEAYKEIADSKVLLERLFKKKITKFCPPRGYTNERLTQYTLNIYNSQRLTKGKNLVHIHPDSGANDNKPWKSALVNKLMTNKDVEIWCHGWEVEKYNLWAELKEVLSEYSQ